jgi:putative hemolysin
MFKDSLFTRWSLLILAILITACTNQQEISETVKITDAAQASIANPASAECEEQGGRVEIREGEAGQYGVCIFPDGSGCDEWALYHGLCKHIISEASALEGINASYINLNYGFTINPSESWRIEDRIDSLLLKHSEFCLFIGFKAAGQALPVFRTGMPAGEFVDGGEFQWLGNPVVKKLLVYENQTMLVNFCQSEYEGCLKGGDLDFTIWLEPCPSNAEAAYIPNIPDEEINEAQRIVESLTLLGTR